MSTRSAALGSQRFRAIINADAAMREVDADDVAEFVARCHGAPRDCGEFRAAERDAAYDAAEDAGGES